MMLHPVGAYLSRFEDRKAAFDSAQAAIELVEDDVIEQLGDPPTSHVALVETAVAEAREALRAEYEQNLQLERERFAETLKLERQRWAAEEGERIASAFEASLRIALEGLKDAVERVLTPFIAREMLERLLDDFVKILQNTIANADNAVVRLSGPKDLLDILERQLAMRSIVISRISESGDELLAQVDFSSIETDITYWMNQVGGVARKDG